MIFRDINILNDTFLFASTHNHLKIFYLNMKQNQTMQLTLVSGQISDPNLSIFNYNTLICIDPGHK